MGDIASSSGSIAEAPAAQDPAPTADSGTSDGASASSAVAAEDPDEGGSIAAGDGDGSDASSVPSPGEATEDRVLSRGGAVATGNGFEFTVYSTVATSNIPSTVVTGDPMPDDEEWLIVRLDVETRIDSEWRASYETIRLVGSSGQEVEVDEVFDPVGNTEHTIGSESSARATQALHLVFPRPDGLTALEGLDLVISDSLEIPVRLPLVGSGYADPYPIALADGAQAVLNTGSISFCDDDGALYSATVTGVTVALENDEGERLPAGERFASVSLALEAENPNNRFWDSGCGQVTNWPDFGLEADGRPSTPNFGSSLPDIEGAAVGYALLEFEIPAEISTLTLVGGAGRTVIGEWSVDLPSAIGEPGGDRVPFDADHTPTAAPAPIGLRPADLVTTELASGGASGNFRDVTITVGASTATNSDPEALVQGSAERDRNGRTWVIVELDAENTVEDDREFTSSQVALIDPSGRPLGVAKQFDRSGGTEYGNTGFDGIEAATVVAVFETDGLVSSADGWNLSIERGDDRPLLLPLAGPAPAPEFPFGLAVGQSGNIAAEEVYYCSNTGLMNATVNQATLDIEGFAGRFRSNSTTRATPETLVFATDLFLDNLLQPGVGCEDLWGWPTFLLEVDGVRLQPFNYETPTIEFGIGGEISLTFEIPADAQHARLLGGDGDLIAEWFLKDAGEVLDDFGATVQETGTLITLDETVLFAFGESRLQSSSTAPLSRVASVVQSEATGEIRITGHTDSIGDESSNQVLSEARAQAVADALVAAGVDASRLVVAGAGELQPVAANTAADGSDNPAGRAQNRRVEVFFTTG